MKIDNISTQQTIFRRSSTTYYYSSLFFPSQVFRKITVLYAFVRLADNFVDQVPADTVGFKKFVKKTWQFFDKPFIPGDTTEQVIADFVLLAKEVKIQKQWIEAFFTSMSIDIPINGKSYNFQKISDLKTYMYGAAEVMGLMMCCILALPESAYVAAQTQGTAMQLANFIRDLDEDCQLGRNYLAVFQKKPELPLSRFKTDNSSMRSEYEEFIHRAIQEYQVFQKSAEKGYTFIPYRYRVPIVTAARLYQWATKIIENEPSIVFKRKVKPSKLRVFWTFMESAVICLKY